MKTGPLCDKFGIDFASGWIHPRSWCLEHRIKTGIETGERVPDPREHWPLSSVVALTARPSWLARLPGLIGLGSIVLLCLYLTIAMILVILVGLGLA